MRNRAAIILLAALLLGFSSPGLSAGTSFDEQLEDAIALVLEHHPSLISQRSLVTGGEEVDLERAGLPLSLTLSTDVGTDLVDDELRVVPMVGMDISLPIIDPDRQVEQTLKEHEFARQLEGDIQSLQDMQEGIVDRFTADLDRIIGYHHKLQGQQALLEQLEKRRQEQEDLVRSGVSGADMLWELDERINDIAVETSQLQSQLILRINSTAYNFGGDRWPDLKQLLEELVAHTEDAVQ